MSALSLTGRSVAGGQVGGAGISSIGGRCWRPSVASCCRALLPVTPLFLLLASVCGAALPGLGAPAAGPKLLAATPPMGWSTWVHYQCGFTAQTILANARALVSTGLAARGYDTVTIDDCWMQKDRDAAGNLVPNPQKFPHGMKPVARAIHALGLKFGVYEAAGYATCQGFAGSGQRKGGGKAHFVQDARLYASWGVNYFKLDSCRVYVPEGSSREGVLRRDVATESAALKSTGHRIIFQDGGGPIWARKYGQLWRTGPDIAMFDAKDPNRPRFDSVLLNYMLNLPLGRFQKPGKWDYPDFIIAGDGGMSLAESRSQMALWSMMSSPLFLSLDVAKLSPEALAIVGNKAVIAVDQDPLGQMATLVRRTPVMDVLFKPLANGDDAVAVLNRGTAPSHVDLRAAEFGFAANSGCRLDATNLWTGSRRAAIFALDAEVGAHDTAIWRIRASASCGRPTRTGAIVLTNSTRRLPGKESYYTRCVQPACRAIKTGSAGFPRFESHTHCLAAPGNVEACTGDDAESWTITSGGALLSSRGLCLADVQGKPVMEACHGTSAQRWQYTLKGNLISTASHQCLSAAWPNSTSQDLEIRPCGHNEPSQVWSLPN